MAREEEKARGEINKKELNGCPSYSLVQLLEANLISLFAEAAAADVEAVLADQALVAAAAPALARAGAVVADVGVLEISHGELLNYNKC